TSILLSTVPSARTSVSTGVWLTRRIGSRGVPMPMATSGHSDTKSKYWLRVSVQKRERLCEPLNRTSSPIRQALIPTGMRGRDVLLCRECNCGAICTICVSVNVKVYCGAQKFYKSTDFVQIFGVLYRAK